MLTPKEKGGGLLNPIYPVEIANSALLSAGDFFSYTPAAAGSGDTWTLNFGYKTCDIATSSNTQGIMGYWLDANNYELVYFNNNALYYDAKVGGTLKAQYRWDSFTDATHHYDFTLSRSSTVVTLEVNGKVCTPMSQTTAVAGTYFFNTTVVHEIGRYSNNYCDGYMSHFRFIDGQALPASTFGEFSDQVTGLWTPKEVVIPTVNVPQTSLIWGGGTVYGSDKYEAPYSAPSGLYDNATTYNPGAWTPVSVADWSAYDFGAGTTKTMISYRMGSDANYGGGYMAKNWNIYGSNDSTNGVDGTWDLLDSVTDQTGWGTSEWRDYTMDATGVYRWYKLDVTANNGLGETIIGAWSGYEDTSYTYTWGVNGRQYLYDNAANLGEDSSRNDNDATVNGSPVQTLDTPTNNYATLNPLHKFVGAGSLSLSSGNNLISADAATYGYHAATFMLPKSGKWYWEQHIANASSTMGIGVDDGFNNVARYSNGFIYSFSGNQSGLALLNGGDVMAVCYDADAATVQFKRNNTDYGTPVDVASIASDIYLYAGEWDSVNATASTMLFGATGYTYTPPSGFKAFCTANLPDPTVMKSASAAQVITRVGTGAAVDIVTPEMEGGPDFVNIKARDNGTNWLLYDTERGANAFLSTNTTTGNDTSITTGLTSFDTNGYSLGSYSQTNSSGVNSLDLALKVGVEQGFEIVTYTGDGTSSKVINHNLGKTPSFMFVKVLDDTQNWYAYHTALGATKGIFLNLTNAAGTSTTYWNDTEPTSTQLTVGSILNTSNNFIAYLFTDSDIFKAFSYTGNGSVDGPFVNLGGRPLAVPFWKNASAATDWFNEDAVRNQSNRIDRLLRPNRTDAEITYAACDFTSLGIKVRDTVANTNGSGQLHVGLAILESTKYSNAY